MNNKHAVGMGLVGVVRRCLRDLILVAVFYIVTCGRDMRFVKFATERKTEALAVRCVNRPATVHVWNGVRFRKVRR